MAGIKEKFKALPRWKKIVLYIFGFLALMAIFGPPAEKETSSKSSVNIVNHESAPSENIVKEEQVAKNEPPKESLPEPKCINNLTLSNGYKINATKCLAVMEYIAEMQKQPMDGTWKIHAKRVDKFCGYPKTANVSFDDEVGFAQTNVAGILLRKDNKSAKELSEACMTLIKASYGDQ